MDFVFCFPLVTHFYSETITRLYQSFFYWDLKLTAIIHIEILPSRSLVSLILAKLTLNRKVFSIFPSDVQISAYSSIWFLAYKGSIDCTEARDSHYIVTCNYLDSSTEAISIAQVQLSTRFKAWKQIFSLQKYVELLVISDN